MLFCLDLLLRQLTTVRIPKKCIWNWTIKISLVNLGAGVLNMPGMKCLQFEWLLYFHWNVSIFLSICLSLYLLVCFVYTFLSSSLSVLLFLCFSYACLSVFLTVFSSIGQCRQFLFLSFSKNFTFKSETYCRLFLLLMFLFSVCVFFSVCGSIRSKFCLHLLKVRLC